MSKHLPPKENRHLKEETPRKQRRNVSEVSTVAREHPEFGFVKRNILETALSVVCFAAACFLSFEGWLGLVLYAVPLAIAAYSVVVRAAEELFSGNYLDESVPVIVAALACFGVGMYCAGAAVAVFYRVGKFFEAAMARTAKNMYNAMKRQLPDRIEVETETGTEKRPPQQVVAGDIYLVAPGEMLALDGVVVEGMSALDTSGLTASAENITVVPGSSVISGCVNVDAPIRVRAEKLFADSTASRVCDALENAHRYKPALQKHVERTAGIYTPVMLGAALLLAVLPPIFNGAWTRWISCGIVFLVLSNTAVLNATVSLSYLGAVAVSARNGIVVKGTRFIEALAKTRTMIFNKTGTLTEGKYTLLDVVPKNMTDFDLLSIAAKAEQYASHPIAEVICAACSGFQRDAREAVKFEEIPGRGISTVVGGKHIYVGNAALLEEHSIHCDIPRRGGAAIHVALNGKYCGYLVVNDKVREGAFDCMEALRVLGVKNTVLLTDDVRSVARPVASSLNFEMVKPEQTPESKVSAVEYLLATRPERSTLAVVCDRASDVEALKRADVGITLAALRSDTALDAADLLIMADDLRRLPVAVRIAKRASDAAIQNVLAFFALRVLLLLLAVSGVLGVLPAAAIDLAAAALMLANSYRTIYNQY